MNKVYPGLPPLFFLYSLPRDYFLEHLGNTIAIILSTSVLYDSLTLAVLGTGRAARFGVVQACIHPMISAWFGRVNATFWRETLFSRVVQSEHDIEE